MNILNREYMKSFNSTLVQLKVIKHKHTLAYIPCFNSTLVQLKEKPGKSLKHIK